MSPEKWDALMEQARREAKVNGERRKVVAVLSWRGDNWVYVVQCGSGCNVCDRRMERARG